MSSFTIVTRPDEVSMALQAQLRQDLRISGYTEDAENPDTIFVVGGDGTFIFAVHRYLEQLGHVRSADDGRRIFARIQDALEKLNRSGEFPYLLTLSIGYVVCGPDDPADMQRDAVLIIHEMVYGPVQGELRSLDAVGHAADDSAEVSAVILIAADLVESLDDIDAGPAVNQRLQDGSVVRDLQDEVLVLDLVEKGILAASGLSKE